MKALVRGEMRLNTFGYIALALSIATWGLLPISLFFDGLALGFFLSVIAESI